MPSTIETLAVIRELVGKLATPSDLGKVAIFALTPELRHSEARARIHQLLDDAINSLLLT